MSASFSAVSAPSPSLGTPLPDTTDAAAPPNLNGIPCTVVPHSETAPCATTGEKFKITNLSYFWSGKRISIPESVTNSKDGPDFSKHLTPDNAESLFKTLTQVQGKGRFVLKKTGFFTKKLELQYRDFWLSPSTQQDDQTADFLARLIANMVEKTGAPADRALKEYLQTPSQDNIEKQVANLKNKFLTASKKEAFTLPFIKNIDLNAQVHKIENNDWRTFLQSYHINCSNKPLGKGNFGTVYDAPFTVNNSSIAYVFKQENKQENGKEVWLNDYDELKGRWWRTGDIAASRIKDLPNFAKTIGFVLELTKNNDKPQRFYVPTDQIERYKQHLLPGAKVRIVGQLMEKAPGEALHTLLQKKLLCPTEHFNNIAYSLFQFLEKTFERNFIHRDFKPENIMYDVNKKELTVIDTGLGVLGGARHKIKAGKLVEEQWVTAKSKNPFFFNILAGTPGFVAPDVIKTASTTQGASGTFYGSEVDFYSVAVTLINVLDHQSFKDHYQRNIRHDKCNSTQQFSSLFGHNSKLTYTLHTNTDIEKTIDLFFAVASEDHKNSNRTVEEHNRKQAFQTLKEHMANISQQIEEAKSAELLRAIGV